MADLADDSDSDAVINLTQVVTVGGLENPNQNAVGGPVRLRCSSTELTAEASFGDFALGATRSPRPLPSSSSIFTTLLPVATSSRPQCTVLKGHRSGSAFSRAEELLVMALRPLRSTSAVAAVSSATIPRRASSSWTAGPRLD